MTTTQEPPTHSHSRSDTPLWRRRWVQIIGAVVLALLVLVAIFDWNWFRGPLERYLSESTGRAVTIGVLGVELARAPRIVLTDIEIANAEWAGEAPLVSLRELMVSVSLPSLLTDEVILPQVRLTEGQANLVRDKGGRANWQLRKSDDDEPSTRTVTVQSLGLVNAQLSYDDAVQNIEVDATGVTRADGPYQTRITYGGRWRGNPFEGTADTGSVLTLTGSSEPFPIRLALRVARTSINLEGQVADIRTLRNVDAQVAVSGPSLSTLYPTLPVALPETPPYRISGRLTRDGDVYSYNGFKGTIGSTDLAGDARFEVREPRPMLTMTLKSRSLDLADLGPLVGLPRRETANAAAPTTAKGKPAAALPSGKVFPDNDFNLERLNAMDADVRLTATALKIPEQIPLEDFFVHLKLNSGVLVLDPLNFGMAGGNLVSTITLDARKDPIAARASIDMRQLRLSELFPTLETVKNTSTGSLGAQIRLTGRGNSVADMLASADGTINAGMAGGRVSELGVWLVNLHGGELLPLLFGGDRPTQIRCGAVAFGVEAGLATAELFVLDTEESRIGGAGFVNLGTERFDITLDPKPKKIGILSLRGPVRLYGTFRDSDFALSPQTIGRGIGAAALALVNPLLALLPLIETGPGQNADCKAVLSEVSGAVRQSGKKISDAPADSAPQQRETPAPIVNVPAKK